MPDLIYRSPCWHTRAEPLGTWCKTCDSTGLIETVLDPDLVLIEHTSTDEYVVHQLTVADILAALDPSP
jgi:hypothetical protein